MIGFAAMRAISKRWQSAINSNSGNKNGMKVALISLAIAAAMGVPASANAGLSSKDEIKREQDRISAEFKSRKQACDSRNGNAKDAGGNSQGQLRQ